MYPQMIWCVKEMRMTHNVKGSYRIYFENSKKKILMAKCASCGSMKSMALPKNLFYKCKD